MQDQAAEKDGGGNRAVDKTVGEECGSVILVVAGHRPPKTGGYSNSAQLNLELFAGHVMAVIGAGIVPSTITGITGMAQGWDQACARAFIRWDIPFIAAIPFVGQEKLWPKSAQDIYHYLIGKAKCVEVISGSIDGGFNHFVSRIMQKRNQWMVDQMADPMDCLITLWDGSAGGTANCIRYAQKKLKPEQIINVWSEWEKFR